MKKSRFIIFVALLIALVTVTLSVSGATNQTFAYTINGTNAGGESNIVSYSSAVERFSSVKNSALYKDGTGYVAVDYSKNGLIATKYDANFNQLSQATVNMELPIFGGFYAGSDFNYILFGQKNPDESKDVEVFKLVKYSKIFEKVKEGSVKDCYTVEPFQAGTVSIAESNGKIVVHTSRKRYKANNVNSQSQFTMIFNKETLAVENNIGSEQENHVSHSFNQIALADGKNVVLLDHGDAYPREVLLNVYSTETKKYSKTTMFTIPGKVGENSTGISVGGVVAGSANYIVAMNSVKHSTDKDVSYGSSAKPAFLTVDERDVVLLVKSKTGTDAAKQVKLTDYVGKNLLASTPYIVKVDTDKFVVCWQEMQYGENNTIVNNGMKFVIVDGNGAKQTGILESKAILAKNFVPVIDGDYLIWYVNNSATERKFYKVSLTKESSTVKPSDSSSSSSTKNDESSSSQSSTQPTSTEKPVATFVQRIMSVKVGKTVKPTFTAKGGKVVFKSSNEAIATVNDKGEITGKGEGNATITMTIDGTDVSDRCLVTVTDENDWIKTVGKLVELWFFLLKRLWAWYTEVYLA